jgi:hypothetical protein
MMGWGIGMEYSCRYCSTGAFLGFEITRTNDQAPGRRPLFVVGISDARPKTRAFVSERTWADQTKSAFSDAGFIAEVLSARNQHSLEIVE